MSPISMGRTSWLGPTGFLPGNRWRLPHARFTLPGMTVITAAICRNEKAIVLAADRAAVLATEGGPLQYDTAESKIRVLQNGVAIAIAGGSDDGFAIFRRIGGMSLAEIPEWIDRERKACRSRFIEERYKTISPTSPFFGQLSPDPEFRFYQEQALVLNSNWVLDFLIAGVDRTGPRLWKITQDGVSDCDSIGFAAIGAGACKALSSLGRWSKEIAKDLPHAVYAAFEAKKDAESTPGVNDKTNLVVLLEGTDPLSWEPEQLELLELAYKELRPPAVMSPESRKHVQELLNSKRKG